MIPVTGDADNNASVGSAWGKYYQQNPEKLLTMYLHRMRKLRERMGVTQDTSQNDGTNNGGTDGGTTPTP